MTDADPATEANVSVEDDPVDTADSQVDTADDTVDTTDDTVDTTDDTVDTADSQVDVDFGEDGLVPAIAQDVETGEVLMLAYVSPEALDRTRETGYAHYYSRSRGELWRKGGSSGHTQAVAEIRIDCDADTLLYLVDQAVGACHTGHRSCFYRTIDGGTVDGAERVFDPDEVY
ncbi:phosphoribosyl-AMP cyclohydrolase [Halorubrum vacuolatum]|uniref:Phosphoribosyl-AMP cyclohydrolase n=1 Tax=Halorubrum vacuolatum TaxID=63740 RepID=A0A238WG07_HALVU|nr:phosphoribosyl-AMP cyclohydrolase [Halorubrum vacuolatum]